MPDRTRPDTDRTTIAQAAARLGISTDAVRKRLARGQLPGEKVGGSWVVFLERDKDLSQTGPGQAADRTSNDKDSSPDRTESGPDGPADRTESGPRPDVDRTETGPDRTGSVDNINALIAAKDETIAVLREQLDARTDELRAAHVIISQLTQRLPQLPAGEPARSRDIGSPDSARPGANGEATRAPEMEVGPPAWRRAAEGHELRADAGEKSAGRPWWRFWGRR